MGMYAEAERAQARRTAAAEPGGHSALGERLNGSERVRTQLALGGALNAGPRAVAQAKLASTLNHGAAVAGGPIQGKWVYNDFDLKDYVGEIADYIETNKDKETADIFRAKATEPKNYNLDVWLKKWGVDWETVMKTIVHTDPQWEKDIFAKSRVTGAPLSGFIPITTVGGKTQKMLEKVPRTGPKRFDYGADENMRTLQTLRQVSTQFYTYLETANQLAKDEQEIQTMWSYGSLIIGSNELGTMNNLYDELTTLKGLSSAHRLFNILKGPYGKKFMAELTKRHGLKLQNLYQSVREPGNTYLQEILDTLVTANVVKITDVTDATQVSQVADNPGNIYVLAAPSPGGVSHAEQRLIEFRNILQDYKADPAAWVAGKKRPCFGCFIKEGMTQDEGRYTLHYLEQPGKLFMGTYRAAPPEEKEKWHEAVADPTLTVYESEKGGGKIAAESESEAESEMEWVEPKKLLRDVARKRASKRKRRSLKLHFNKAGVDFDEVSGYVKGKDEDSSKVDSDKEEMLQKSVKRLKTYSESSPNPAVKTMFAFTEEYEKQTTS